MPSDLIPFVNATPEQLQQQAQEYQAEQALAQQQTVSDLTSVFSDPNSFAIAARAKTFGLSSDEQAVLNPDLYNYIYNRPYFDAQHGNQLGQLLDQEVQKYTPQNLEDDRSTLERLKDNAVNMGWGFARMVPDVAALAMSGISPDTALAINRGTNNVSDWITENLQSDYAQKAAKVSQINDLGREALLNLKSNKRNEAQHNSFMNKLEDLGDSFLTWGKSLFEDPNALEKGFFETVPSTLFSLGAGAALRAGTKAATATLPVLNKVAASSVGRGLSKYAPEMVINSLLEAGSTRTEAIGVLDQMSPDQLRESPLFTSLEEQNIAKGQSPETAFENAKDTFAKEIGTEVSLMAGALGAGTGLINPELSGNTRAFQQAFLRSFVPFAKNTALSVPKEAIQEAIEGGGEAFAQNLALRNKEYPVELDKDIIKSSAQSAVLGGLTGGAVPVAAAGARKASQILNTASNIIHRNDFNQKGKELSQVINAKQDELLNTFETDPVFKKIDPELKPLHKQINEYIKDSKDILIGRNAIEAEGSPFEQNLKAISGRNDITDKTADIFDDNKPLVENYTNIVQEAEKLAKKGQGKEAIMMLQDAQAMATIINAAAKLGTVAFDAQIKPLLDDIPDVDEKEWKNLSQPEQQAQALKKYANVALALTGFNLEQTKAMDKELKLMEDIPELIKNTPSLSSWFNEIQDNPEKLNSISEEDKKLFHSINKATVLYDENVAKSPEKKKHLIQLLEQFVKDKTLDEETREIYKRALPGLKSQVDFLNQANANQITEIHLDLLTSDKKAKDKIGNEKGKHTAIPTHTMKLARDYIAAKKNPNEITKENLRDTFKQAYNFLWSESRKYYALNAARATSLNNTSGKSEPTEYNSYGVDKITGKSYWSVQSPVGANGKNHRKSIYWNNAKSPALVNALEYEIGTLKSILNDYINDINNILGSNEFSPFTYEEGLFKTNAKGQYDKYAKLAKETPKYTVSSSVPAQSTSSPAPVSQTSGSEITSTSAKPKTEKTITPATEDKIQQTIDTLSPESKINDYNADSSGGIQLITYRGKAILNKVSDKWQEVLELDDFAESKIISDNKTNKDLDQLYQYLLKNKINSTTEPEKETKKPVIKEQKSSYLTKAIQYIKQNHAHLPIQIKEDASIVSTGAIDYKTNTLLINPNTNVWEKKFKEKAWKTPRKLKDGSQATPLIFDFPSLDSFIYFTVEHELQHIIQPQQKENEPKGKYEDRINKAAIQFLTEHNYLNIKPQAQEIKPTGSQTQTAKESLLSTKQLFRYFSRYNINKRNEFVIEAKGNVKTFIPFRLTFKKGQLKNGNPSYQISFNSYRNISFNKPAIDKLLKQPKDTYTFSTIQRYMIEHLRPLILQKQKTGGSIFTTTFGKNLPEKDAYKITNKFLWELVNTPEFKEWVSSLVQKNPDLSYITIPQISSQNRSESTETSKSDTSINSEEKPRQIKSDEQTEQAKISHEEQNQLPPLEEQEQIDHADQPQLGYTPSSESTASEETAPDNKEKAFIKEILNEFIELNQDKQYNRDQTLKELFMDNPEYRTQLDNWLYEQNQKDHYDYDFLNNSFYLQTMITDFLDLKENNNPERTVPTFGFVLKNILPKLAPNLSNGFTIMRELRSKKEEENKFKDYFHDEWKKVQDSIKKEPFRYNRAILDKVISISEAYKANEKIADEFSAPEAISDILQANNIEPEQINLDSLFQSKAEMPKIMRQAVKAFHNAFGSLTKEQVFGHKQNLLNYASSPKELLRKLLNKAINEAKKDNSEYYSKAYQYNKNAMSIKPLLANLDASYDMVSKKGSISLKAALNDLFFAENSLSERIYKQLEEVYTKPNVYNPNSPLAYNSSAIRRNMLNQNRDIESGTSYSEKNRTFWLTPDENGKPKLNRHLIEKAIMGTIVSLAQNDTGKLNVGKEMDDIDDEFPGINMKIKQTMARTLSAERLLKIIRNNIEKYTDIAFKDNIDIVTKGFLINGLATDILRILENEGLFIKHQFAMSRKENDATFSKFAVYYPKRNETWQKFYKRLDDISKENEAKGYKTVWYRHFEFNPQFEKFYAGVSENTRKDLESFNLLSTVAPDLIDTLVFPENNQSFLIGKEGELPIATNQKHTDEKLTDSQKANIKKRQSAKYFLNKNMFSIAKVLATNTNDQGDSYIDVLLGRTNRTKDNKDVLDDIAASIDGQKIATGNSIGNMTGLIARMLAQGGEQGIADIPLRFKYDIQRMGRLMLDGYNPQSDKMFRELFLPEAENVNLSNPQQFNIFLRAVLQSFGGKVQYIKSGQDQVALGLSKTIEQGLEKERIELESELNKDNKLNNFIQKKSVQDFQNLICSEDFSKALNQDTKQGFQSSALASNKQKIITDFISDLTSYLGSDSSWIALHGMMEYLRYNYYQKNNPEQLKNFSTQLYLEADGIASGASNSIYLFSTISDYGNIVLNPSTEKREYPAYNFMLRAGGGFGITGSFGSIMEQTKQKKDDDIYGSIAKSMKRELSSLMEGTTKYDLDIMPEKTPNWKKNDFLAFDKNIIQEYILPLQKEFTDASFKIFSNEDNAKTLHSAPLSKFTYNLLALYSSLVPAVELTSMSDLEKNFNIKRNWIKSPLTKYNYGAGAKSIAQGLVEGNSLYPGIVSSYLEKLTDYNLAKTKEERDSLRKELKEITYRILVASSFSLKKTQDNGYASSYAYEPGKNNILTKDTYESLLKDVLVKLNNDEQVPTDFAINPKLIQVLTQNTEALISQTMSDVITNEMYGEAFAANKKLIVSASSLMSLIYSSLYIDRTLQEVDKKNTEAKASSFSSDSDINSRFRWLTKREQNKIADELKDFAPLFSHHLTTNPAERDVDTTEMNLDSDFLSVKTGKLKELMSRFSEIDTAKMGNNIKSASLIKERESNSKSNKYNTYPSGLDMKLPMDSGVLVLPQAVVNMTEASIMQIMAAWKATGLDVYDGFNMPVGQVASLGEGLAGLGEQANKAVFETWSKANLYEALGKRLDTFYAKLYGKGSEETPYAKLFHSNLSKPWVPTDKGKFDFNTSLNDTQKVFVQNMMSAMEGLQQFEAGQAIINSLNLANLKKREDFAKALLPFSNEADPGKKTENIKKILFGIRLAMLQGEQAIKVKQVLLKGFTDFSTDQMGGGATPYIHKAEPITYTDKKTNEIKNITPIPTFAKYKKQNNLIEKSHQNYLEEVFIPEYKKAYDNLLNNSKEFDFMAMTKGTILEDIIANNSDTQFYSKILLHTQMVESLNNALFTGSIQVSEQAKEYDPNKEIRVYTAKEALQYARKKLVGTRYAKRFKVLNNLLQIMEENKEVLADYKIIMPSSEYMNFLIQNMENEEVKTQLTDFFSKNNIAVDYYNKFFENPTAYGNTEWRDYKVIAIFLNNISKENLDYNDALASTILHELCHAYLASYLDQNIEVTPDNQLQITSNKRNQLEQTSLEHLVEMFNEYMQISEIKADNTIWRKFNEFITKCLTKDYEYLKQEKASEYEVAPEKTLGAKFRKISNLDKLLAKATDLLKKLINAITKSTDASNLFEQGNQAAKVLMQSANFFEIQNKKSQNKTDVLADEPNGFFSNVNHMEKGLNEYNFIQHDELIQQQATAFPQELALVTDNGFTNLQVNQQLHNIASILKLSPEEQIDFTVEAKNIYSLLRKNPTQLSEAISAIQEFYKQLDPDKLANIASKVTTDMQEIKDLAQILQNSFEDLAKINIKKGKNLKQHSFPMIIPAIIALNNISPAFQEITSQMSYSLVRKVTNKNMNQRIRDIGHNIYMALQGKNKNQIVQEQLRNLQDEAEVEFYLRWLKYTPTINPALNTIDNQFNSIINSALDYLASSKNPVLRLLPLATYATNEAFGDLMDNLTKNISNDTLASLLADMLPSSQYKKPFYLLRKIVKSNLDQERQDARVNKPNHIKNLFKNTYSNNEWKSLTRSIGHTDLACLSEADKQLVFDAVQNNTTNQLISSAKDKCKELFDKLEQAGFRISQGTSSEKFYNDYIVSLAQYLATHKITTPKSFNKNAFAIGASFLGQDFLDDLIGGLSQNDITKYIDEAATLASISYLSDENKKILQKVINQDSEALHKTLNILQETKKNEEHKLNQKANATLITKLNAWKGYMPTTVMAGSSILIARESDRLKLEKEGYTYLKQANTLGTNLQIHKSGNTVKDDPLAYYYTNMPRKSMFNEGAFAIVLPSYFGINTITQYTMDDPQLQKVSSIADAPFNYEQLQNPSASDAISLVPIYKIDDTGKLFVESHEMFINDDDVLNTLEYQDYLPEMMGFWDGRQKEEDVATQYNLVALNLMLEKYEPSHKEDFINILDRKKLTKVQQDAVEQIPWNIRMLGSQMFKDKYGLDGIYIRKDMLRDAIGQRSASVMDIYNGITNLNPKTQAMIKKGLETMFGKKAYQIAVGAEQSIQGLTSIARNMIVIKSCKVMTLNNFGNIWHLLAVGVPFKFIITQIPKLLKESETYAQYGFEYQKLLVERDAVDTIEDKKKVQAQIDMLDAKIKSLSIAPILSEFSSINDLGMDTEDLELMRGQVASWVTKQINKLPKNMVVAGKHILMTKDTPQYQFLEKATQYGDFIAKAILYKYMTQHQNYAHEEARYRVLDEFVNYDQLAGRSRSYLENMGLLWFFNYKLRIMKVAARLLHNNPFRAMLMLYGEQWSPAGNAGNVLEDSLLGKLISGDIGFTVGPGMLWRGLQMHPLLELLS